MQVSLEGLTEQCIAHLYVRALYNKRDGMGFVSACHPRDNLGGALVPHVFTHSMCMNCGTIHEHISTLPIQQCCGACIHNIGSLVQWHGIQLQRIVWSFSCIPEDFAIRIQQALSELALMQEDKLCHNMMPL